MKKLKKIQLKKGSKNDPSQPELIYQTCNPGQKTLVTK
jgi:hypothetical protein